MNFPYAGWIIGEDFKPSQQVLVKSHQGTVYHVNKKGEAFHSRFIYPSLGEAVRRGNALLKDRQDAIDTKQQTLNKHRQNLESVQL